MNVFELSAALTMSLQAVPPPPGAPFPPPPPPRIEAEAVRDLVRQAESCAPPNALALAGAEAALARGVGPIGGPGWRAARDAVRNYVRLRREQWLCLKQLEHLRRTTAMSASDREGLRFHLRVQFDLWLHESVRETNILRQLAGLASPEEEEHLLGSLLY